MTFVLAADIGGTRAKAGLFDMNGLQRAFTVVPTPSGEGSWPDPRVLLQTFERLVAGLPPEPVTTIAVTAFTRSQVFVDGAGTPVAAAIGFRDTRAEEEAEHVVLPDGAGDGAPVSAFHPLARLAWLRRHDPAGRERTVWMLTPKDAINLWLTGAAAMDAPSNAALHGVTHRVLPPRRLPQAHLGIVRAGLPGALGRLAGARVVVSAMDAWCAARGMGATTAGEAYALLGTTSVLGLLARQGVARDGVLCVGWDEELLHLGGPTQTGADALIWLTGLAGRRVEDAPALLAAAGPEPPIFLPHLLGERTPFWDSTLKGALLRLDRAHGMPDLVFAVAEGVAFQLRLILERAEAACDVTADALRLSGGGADDRWAQLLADALDRPVLRCDEPEPALLGAASLAIGRLLDPPRATGFQPDAARAAWHDARYLAWQQAVPMLAGLDG